LEARKNIQSKLGSETIKRFYNNKKEVHVVAAAPEVRAAFLVTLDKGHVLEVNKSGLVFQALSPGEFIKVMLPNHVDYPSTRD
jgi:predicted nucleic acid-binding protein